MLDVLESTVHYRGPGGEYGEDDFVVSRADAEFDEGPGLQRRREGQTLDMRVEERACTDAMSGETFAYTVW